MENAAELQTQLVESVTHIRTVKEFGIEEFSNIKTENRFVKLLFTTYKSGLNGIFAGTSTQFLASFFYRSFNVDWLWICHRQRNYTW
jgi:ATP-binding cassette subfamily B protein